MFKSTHVLYTQSSLPCEPPSANALQACQRRDLMITPDRRSFIQSMSQDAARQISGNAVPATTRNGGIFAYTFPAQPVRQTVIPSSSRYHQSLHPEGLQPTQHDTPRRLGNGADGLPMSPGYATPIPHPSAHRRGSTPVTHDDSNRGNSPLTADSAQVPSNVDGDVVHMASSRRRHHHAASAATPSNK